MIYDRGEAYDFTEVQQPGRDDLGGVSNFMLDTRNSHHKEYNER